MDPKPIMDPSNGFLEGPKEFVTKAKIQNPSVISDFFFVLKAEVEHANQQEIWYYAWILKVSQKAVGWDFN